MATTSEIQVTEAYIGLLGRAPDPAGLAYWTAQLDAAVAAGDTASDALKKLTNDITLSAEWDAGIGVNDASTQAGAEAVVTSMYDNLFDRAATASDLTYWSAELVAGTTTASEMAVQLIVAAQANTTNTTDASVLGFKQSAATYYVESVDQDDFSRESANLAVKDVNGPISLDTSKDATDALVSGTGLTFTLTTGDDSADLVMTLGDDAITGTVGSGATYQDANDAMNDVSTGDSDTVSLSGNAGFAFGSITNVEAVNIALAKQVGTAFSLTGVQNVTGSTLNIDVAPTVTIAGVEVTGETDVGLTGGLRSDVTTTDVTSLTAALATGTSEAALTITGDVDLATVTLTSVADSDTNIVLADNDSTVNLSGTAATNDAASITAVGDVALVVSTADVEEITLAGSTNDVEVTVSGVTTEANMTYTTTGEHDVTLTGAATQFDGSTITQSGTGDTGFKITTAGDLDVWSAGALGGGIELAVDQGGSDTYTLADGTNFTINVAQTGSTHVLDANDASTSSSITVFANQNAGTIQTVDFETVLIDANDSQAIALAAVDTDGNDGTTTIAGSNDITISGALNTAGDTVISGKKLVISGDTDVTEDAAVAAGAAQTSGDLTLTATDDISVAALSVQNDITLTATNDITVTGTSDAVEGAYTVTGDDFNAQDTLAAQNDITITTTNDITSTSSIATSNGDITLSGNEIDVTSTITASAGDVTLTATNDASTSTIGGGITADALTLADGEFSLSSVATADSVVISGDTDLTGGSFKTASVAITSTNDIVISDIDEAADGGGFVIAGSAASGDIQVTTDSTATTDGTATIYTGSGNDTVTLNDSNTTFVVSTGGNTGTETITGTLFGTGSVINSNDGADTIDINSTEAVALTISSGAGDDTVSLASTSVTGTFDLGDGTGDKVVIESTGGGEPTALGLKNIEELDISAVAVEFTWADLSGNDSSFKLIGANTLTITGSSTADTIDASTITADAISTGNIQVDGAAGNDVITGAEQMVNVINGEAGIDVITGGDAGDTLDGGSGNDTITAGEGVDTITGGTGADTIVLTDVDNRTDTVNTGSGVGAEADTVTGYTVSQDVIAIDISEVEATSTIIGDLIDATGNSLTASSVVEVTDIPGTFTGLDLVGSTDSIHYVVGTFASTSEVEDALEAGGSNQLTASAAMAANDAFLIIYDDGTDSYLAAVNVGNTTTDSTFNTGDLTVEIIATLSGVADGSTIDVVDLNFI